MVWSFVSTWCLNLSFPSRNANIKIVSFISSEHCLYVIFLIAPSHICHKCFKPFLERGNWHEFSCSPLVPFKKHMRTQTYNFKSTHSVQHLAGRRKFCATLVQHLQPRILHGRWNNFLHIHHLICSLIAPYHLALCGESDVINGLFIRSSHN